MVKWVKMSRGTLKCSGVSIGLDRRVSSTFEREWRRDVPGWVWNQFRLRCKMDGFKAVFSGRNCILGHFR